MKMFRTAPSGGGGRWVEAGVDIINMPPQLIKNIFLVFMFDPSWGGPIELFFVPASAPRLV